MSLQVVGTITSMFGLALIVVSALVLNDTIEYKNRQWELQHLPYIKYGYDVFWDQFKFDDDILVILTPMTLLVGLVQFFLPALFCCLGSKDLKKMVQLWIGTNVVLFIMSLACFVISCIYRVDTLGFKRVNYEGRFSNTYLHSSWYYDKGQAFMGVLGCDTIILIIMIIMMIRWRLSMRRQPGDFPAYQSSPIHAMNSKEMEYMHHTKRTAV